MNKTIKNKIRLVTALVLLTPSLAFATNGYFAHGWGMKSKAMAGAGIATGQDGLAAATNPAGMVVVGNRLDFGLDVFSPDRTATISGNGGGGNQTADGNGDDNFLIPEFGYNQMINSTMSFGVSVYGNGGMNTNYENGINLFNGGSGQETGINLSQLFIAPTFAMKINKDHAFGVAINLAYQTFEAKGINGFAGISSNSAALSDNGADSSTGFGFSLGYIGQLSPDFSLGVNYRSRTYMSEFDKYAGLFAEQGDFDIPSMYGVGLKYTPTSAWTLLFDYSRINYSEIAAIANAGTNFLLPGGALGQDNGAGFGWVDMDVYKLGVSWNMSKTLTLRGGWSHNSAPIPAGETLFNVLAPATVQDHLTLGATWVLSGGSELTVAYMHAFEKSVDGSSSIPAAFGSGEAKIGMSQDSLGVAYGYSF